MNTINWEEFSKKSREGFNKLIKKKEGKMYTVPRYRKSTLKVNKSVQGETIEQKIERIINNKEPIKDGAPLLYTERKEGIRASTNIRTDRFEIAVEASDKIAKSYKARREEKGKAAEKPEKVGGPESTQGKEQSSTDTPK